MLNPRLLEEWKNEVKEKGHVNCPNDVSQGGWEGMGTLGLRTEGPGLALAGALHVAPEGSSDGASQAEGP